MLKNEIIEKVFAVLYMNERIDRELDQLSFFDLFGLKSQIDVFSTEIKASLESDDWTQIMSPHEFSGVRLVWERVLMLSDRQTESLKNYDFAGRMVEDMERSEAEWKAERDADGTN